ncbi:MAG: S-layer homology domain-containing protein, partial [Clostridia bacterium]|nr:S-layer homology domain-containing protein [Clostridia bacterium]
QGKPKAASTVGFCDVPADAYYAEAVAWAFENSITAGTSVDTFSPDAPCTRGQIVTFLHNAIE